MEHVGMPCIVAKKCASVISVDVPAGDMAMDLFRQIVVARSSLGVVGLCFQLRLFIISRISLRIINVFGVYQFVQLHVIVVVRKKYNLYNNNNNNNNKRILFI